MTSKWRTSRGRAIALVVAALVLLFILRWFGVQPFGWLLHLLHLPDNSEVVECVPQFVEVDTNAPPIRKYAAEFAAKWEALKKQTADSQPLPRTNAALLGQVWFTSTNPACGAVIVQAFTEIGRAHV